MLYFVLHTFSAASAHRFFGYFEEEAINTWTRLLKMIDDGKIENKPATEVAKAYWNLPDDAHAERRSSDY